MAVTSGMTPTMIAVTFNHLAPLEVLWASSRFLADRVHLYPCVCMRVCIHVCVEGGGVNVRLIHGGLILDLSIIFSSFFFKWKVYTTILVFGCIFAYSVHVGILFTYWLTVNLGPYVCVINVQNSPPVDMHNYTMGSHYQSLKAISVPTPNTI